MLDHGKVRDGVATRTEELRREAVTVTDAETISFQLDVVDLIVNGATVRQVANHYGCSMSEARAAYVAGLERLTDRSIERSMGMREEITARQRLLIFANMPRAKAGDRQAAQIVDNADQLLASIWAVRSLRVELPPRDPDPGIAAAMEGYLAGLAAQGGNRR